MTFNHLKQFLFIFILSSIFFSSQALAENEENSSQEKFDMMEVILSKTNYAWNEEIKAEVIIHNIFDEKLSISFNNSCYFNGYLNSENTSYTNIGNRTCLESNDNIEIPADKSQAFTFILKLKEAPGLEEGEYDFKISSNGYFFKNGKRQDQAMNDFQTKIKLIGNVSLNTEFDKQIKTYDYNEKINAKYSIKNNGNDSYKTLLDECSPIVSIYNYYSKQLIFQTKNKDCIDTSNEILVPKQKESEKRNFTVYDPEKNGVLNPGKYTIKLQLIDDAYAPQSNFSNMFEILEKPIEITDINDSFAKNYIEQIISQKIMSPLSDNLFKPLEKVTRGEFTKYILNAINIPILNKNSISNTSFIDVKKDNKYFEYIETAKQEGLIKTDSKYFFPDQQISKIEGLLITIKALNKILDLNALNQNFYSIFQDISENWQKQYAMTAYNLNLIDGTENDSKIFQNIFNPKENLTRDFTAKLLINLQNLIKKDLKVQNNNVLLRYLKSPKNTDIEEYDLLVCENGKAGFYYLNPESNSGGYYFITQIISKDISEKLLSILYKYNFFTNLGYYETCPKNINCKTDHYEELTNYFNSTEATIQGAYIKENLSDFETMINEMTSYFFNLKESSDIQIPNSKNGINFFDENFCL
jgi:hypothetical protein